MPAHLNTRFDQLTPGAFGVGAPCDTQSLEFTHGQAVDYQLEVTGPCERPLAWSLTGGNLPPGLSFNGGVISGTPTAVGTSEPVTVQVVDGSTPAKFATAAFIITII